MYMNADRSRVLRVHMCRDMTFRKVSAVAHVHRTATEIEGSNNGKSTILLGREGFVSADEHVAHCVPTRDPIAPFIGTFACHRDVGKGAALGLLLSSKRLWHYASWPAG
jgi:hypothetical protein